MSLQYSGDIYRCARCGCSRPEVYLSRIALTIVTDVLNPFMYVCTDAVDCASIIEKGHGTCAEPQGHGAASGPLDTLGK